MKTKDKFLQSLLSLIFFVFAYLQLNDPDPEIWATLYVVVALLCLVPLAIRPNKKISAVYSMAMAILVIAIITYIPDVISWIKMGMPTIVGSMKADKPYIEFVREAGGLIICLGALAYTLKMMKSAKLSQ